MELESTDLCDYCVNPPSCQLFHDISVAKNDIKSLFEMEREAMRERPQRRRPIEDFAIASEDRCCFRRNALSKELGILEVIEKETWDYNPVWGWMRPFLWMLNLVLQVYCSKCGYLLLISNRCLCPRCGHYEDDGI